jgi:ribosomal protein S27AE
MSTNAYTTQFRALMCPACGAPVTIPPHGGQFQCGYCRAIGSVGARNDGRVQRPPPSPADEQARIAKLQFQKELGPHASPYSTFLAPQDLQFLVALRPPHSWRPWFEAWKNACVMLAQQGPTEPNQKRVAWLATLTATGVLNLGSSDPMRARAIRETALELLKDAGHQHVIRCVLSRGACLQRDTASAEQWLAACDPYPSNITLDSEYRMAAAYLHTASGRWNGVLEVLGNQPNVIPLDFGRDLLGGLLRVNACEELGYTQAADGQLDWLFQEERKLDFPILLGIMKTNAPLGLCRRICARRGIQIPQ